MGLLMTPRDQHLSVAQDNARRHVNATKFSCDRRR
jgi:hypothetical protein